MFFNYFKKNKQEIVAYSDWISDIEKKSFIQLGKSTHQQLDDRFLPLFSIILIDRLQGHSSDVMRTINSIVHQKNNNWELVFVSDASQHYPSCAKDQRIKIIPVRKCDDDLQLFNSAVSFCSGDFVTFLCPGDQLSPYAVALLSVHCSHVPGTQLIVTDEDVSDESGRRYSPHFKPDWNPDYLLNFNYFSKAVVYSKKLFLDVGGFKANSADPYHALALKTTQVLDDKQVSHIDYVLFHFRKRQQNSQVTDVIKRVQYPVPQPSPLVSIIIPTRDQLDLLRNCIDGLLNKTTYQNFEIIVIDNESEQQVTKDYLNELSKNTKISILAYNKPFNYSEMNNLAVKKANGDILAFLNNDVSMIDENKEDWLTEMVSQACRPEIGCVGAKLFYPDGTIQHAGVILGLKGYASHAHKGYSGESSGYFNRLVVTHNVSAVTAACMLVRKQIFDSVGGFDAINLKIAYNDVDFCLKVREAGYRNLFTPHAQLIHHESKSRGKKRNKKQSKELKKEAEYLRQKWGNELFCDPAYNKNLTLSREDFSLKNKSDTYYR